MKIKKLLLIILIILIFLSGCIKQKELTNSQFSSTATETYSKNYGEVLEEYKTFVKDYYGKEKEILPKYESDPWGTMLTTVMFSAKLGDHGYAFRNLSENDVPELLLITKQEDNDYFINAIYSFVDNKPKLLETYWYRSRCSTGTDGFIYISGSNGALNSQYLKCKIKSDRTDIEVIEKIESSDEKINEQAYNNKNNGTICYYRTMYDGKKSEITELEFDSILSQIPQDNKQSQLEFIPLQ